jgi:DNA topoisomerase IB
MRKEHVSLNGTWITFDYPAKSGQRRVQYIKAISGSDFSAKDFRTWNATMVAAVSLGPTAATRRRRMRASGRSPGR